jgi:two-component system cell cycle sensor histidine kinase/response regulator CckA
MAAAARRTPRGPRILLVEDEAAIREVLARVLHRHGYQLLVAADGREALELVEKEGGDVDLLISDLVMPGQNGADVASEVRARVPHVSVLFMSGSLDHPVLKRVLASGHRFLPKPFSMTEFRSVVSEAMAECA